LAFEKNDKAQINLQKNVHKDFAVGY
jgi:hypothetical protein